MLGVRRKADSLNPQKNIFVEMSLTFLSKILRKSRYGTLKLRVLTPRPQEPTWNNDFAGEGMGNLCKLIYLPHPMILFTELLFL